MLGSAPLASSPLGAGFTSGSPDPDLDVVLTDVIRISRTALPNVRWANMLATDTFSLSVASIHGFGIDGLLLDEIVATDSGVGLKGYFRELTDAIDMQSDLASVRILTQSFIDSVRIVEGALASRGVSALALADLGISESLTAIYGLVVVERLRVADPHIINWIANADAADLVTFSETLRQLFPVDLAEGVGIGVDHLAQLAVALLERLRIQPQLQSAARFNITVSQILRLRVSLGNFFGAEIAEAVAFAHDLTNQKLAITQVAETVGIGVSMLPQFLLAVRVTDAVGIDDADVVNMLFAPTVAEGVEITAGYVSPNGSITAWVMNTRTAAVTEYRNFAFNSFARVGNRYLAASDDGLFELLGDDDAGDDIIARIRSGFMQFGGTQLSRLKSAYIAARGEGEVLLKVIDGDGREYLYSCDTRDMRSTKVHMGKGMRSRYFAFELTTVGQDFDIDTIEFVPIVVQRRV